jgi:hypothetical protein
MSRNDNYVTWSDAFGTATLTINLDSVAAAQIADIPVTVTQFEFAVVGRNVLKVQLNVTG